jgi:hypothetical protein
MANNRKQDEDIIVDREKNGSSLSLRYQQEDLTWTRFNTHFRKVFAIQTDDQLIKPFNATQ